MRRKPKHTTPALRYNAYSRQYEKELIAFARKMCKSMSYHFKAVLHRTGIITYDSTPDEINNTIKKMLKSWSLKADELAPALTKKQLSRLQKYVNGKYKPFFKKDYDKTTRRIQEVIKARFIENIALIKSIVADVIKRYESVLFSAVTGGDEASIIRTLRTIEGVTERQARRIARDQTAKAIEALNFAKSEELGLEYYYWETSQDERVSTGKGGHKQLHGKVFKYGKPEAVIDSYGNVGHPAERVNCRCTALGVFLSQGERIVKAKDGVGYEIIK